MTQGVTFPLRFNIPIFLQHAMRCYAEDFSNKHQSKWAKVALPGVCIIIFYIRLGILCCFDPSNGVIFCAAVRTSAAPTPRFFGIFMCFLRSGHDFMEVSEILS